MLSGQKHLVQCRCVLPQFRHAKEPLLHQFAVFSVIEDDQVVQKLVQCNNCGVVHRVFDLNKSEILSGVEDLSAVVNIDDVKESLSQELVARLEQFELDVATWEHVKFVCDRELWGSVVVVATDSAGGFKQHKYIRILGRQLYNVDTVLNQEYVQ